MSKTQVEPLTSVLKRRSRGTHPPLPVPRSFSRDAPRIRLPLPRPSPAKLGWIAPKDPKEECTVADAGIAAVPLVPGVYDDYNYLQCIYCGHSSYVRAMRSDEELGNEELGDEAH